MGAGQGAGQGQGSAGGPLSQGEDKRGLRSWRPQIGNLDVYVGSTAKPSSNRLRRSQALWEHRGNTGKAQSGGTIKQVIRGVGSQAGGPGLLPAQRSGYDDNREAPCCTP